MNGEKISLIVGILICINSSTCLRDHDGLNNTRCWAVFLITYGPIWEILGDRVFLSFTIGADVVILGSVMSILNLNYSPMLRWAQRQTTKTGCTKVKLYQQSSLPEVQNFISFAIEFDIMLYTEIWDAFSWVDLLIIQHPILINSFPCCSPKLGNFIISFFFIPAPFVF